MEDRLRVGVVRMGLGCAAVLAGAGWAGAQPSSGPFPLPALAPAPAGVRTYLDTTAGMEFSVVNTAGIVPYVSNRELAPRVIGANVPSYAISRTEVTQGQFVEFLNATRQVPLPPADAPNFLSVRAIMIGTFGFSIGVDYVDYPSSGRPVWGATAMGAQLATTPSWFGAAMYCNWLHNNRQSSYDAIINGAYDLRHFDDSDPSTFAGITRQAGARYWIPSFDEASIAAYWDPNRNGPGQQGWWQSVNRRDRLPIYGPPTGAEAGETSAGYIDMSQNPPSTDLPVGAYADEQSAFGLFDTSGSAHEWTDSVYDEGIVENQRNRLFVGSQAGEFSFGQLDQLSWYGATWPSVPNIGFRLATIPSPSVGGAVVVSFFMFGKRRRYQ
jgi:formylglycine-generating enzyme required for sulfatase activity